ncbi:MAG: dynein regulation protein LC7 [Chloroflexi bacterium AL-N1]|nr:dynein regulation protein LC7 [Chloroflexi bacterium AL-N1]NOK92195.1 dynein regulation protein LC7 [Chloroflexi bacterium AL-N15]
MTQQVTRSEQLTTALDRLIASNPTDITGAAVITTDGILLSSRLGADITINNPDRVAAIAATMMGVTTRVVNELKIGQAEEAIVRAVGGYLLITPVMSQVCLAILLRRDANLGLARLDANDIGKLIKVALDGA